MNRILHAPLGRRAACQALAAFIAAWAGSAAAADAFPSKLVTFVVPFAAGTAGDQWARMVSPKLSELWKQPVIVENKAGASGMIGAGYVMRSNPDGHTLLLGSLSTAMAKLTQANAQFDPQAELVPVFKYLNFKMIVATNAATYAKAKNLSELVALSKSTPSGIFFGGIGAGTSLNMTGGFVFKGLGLKYTEVNYTGTAPVTVALMRDDVQFLVNTPSSLKAQMDNGGILPLAVISDKRDPDMPNVQTVREAGYQGFIPTVWNGIFAPKNTPQSVLDKIAADLLAVSMAPDMKSRIESTFTGTIPRSTPQNFARELEADTKQWREYLTSINFKPE